MVTTSYVDFTAGLNSIPDRTDNTGTGIKDLSGREEPLPNRLLDRGGTLTPANAFVPQKGTGDFDVDLGSGTADQDLYVVESDVTGQAPLLVRLEDTNATVTLDAADADDRWDQIFLVVRDATEDGNTDGQTLARLSYRKGDSGTSPSKPGADSEWVHYELIASILVPGGATSITGSDITDERTDSSLLQKLFDESIRRTAASVFGSVLDSRYAELSGDTFAGAVDMGSNKITSLADPTADQDSATKSYVDGRDANGQVFTADGTFTVPSTVERVWFEMVGAGGGGGGSSATSGAGPGGGGGGGAGISGTMSVTPGNSVTVTVGSGGAGGGTDGSDGSNGGSSSFGSHTAAGGSGGGGDAGSGGAGGSTPSSGDHRVAGTPGGKGDDIANDFGVAGGGGASMLGAGSPSEASTGTKDGISATQSGGGGSGAITNSSTGSGTGGSGADGVVVVRWVA